MGMCVGGSVCCVRLTEPLCQVVPATIAHKHLQRDLIGACSVHPGTLCTFNIQQEERVKNGSRVSLRETKSAFLLGETTSPAVIDSFMHFINFYAH